MAGAIVSSPDEYDSDNMSGTDTPNASTEATKLTQEPVTTCGPGPVRPSVIYTSAVGLGSLPGQVRRAAARRGADLTLMVVGESGVGKKSLIHTLFGDSVTSVFPVAKQPGAPNTTNLEICQAVYDEEGFEGRFTIVTTSGFGDFTSNAYAWSPITSYIDAQLQAYMLQEEQPDRRRITDTRVHACVYLITPTGHGLSALDIAAMAEIGRRTNLVPVIAKADAFTKEDLAGFKASIRQAVVDNGITPFWPCCCAAYGGADDSSAENGAGSIAGTSAGTSAGTNAGTNAGTDVATTTNLIANITEAVDWPPAVITSTKEVPISGGSVVRGRGYRWGAAEVDNPGHSDFAKLRSMLMAENMLELVTCTHEVHYRAHREKLMRARLIAAQEQMIAAASGGNSKSEAISDTDRHCAGRSERGEVPRNTCSSDLDDVLQAGQWDSLSSLEILGLLAPFGREYLAVKLLDVDRQYEQRVRGIQTEFSIVARFQEERFKSWHENLVGYKAAFETEIADQLRANKQLEHEVSRLEQMKPGPRTRLLA